MPIDFTGLLIGLTLWIGGTVTIYRFARGRLAETDPRLFAASAAGFLVSTAAGVGSVIGYEWLRGRM